MVETGMSEVERLLAPEQAVTDPVVQYIPYNDY